MKQRTNRKGLPITRPILAFPPIITCTRKHYICCVLSKGVLIEPPYPLVKLRSKYNRPKKGGGCCLLQDDETNKLHVSYERLANLLPTFILQNRNDEYNFEHEYRSYVSPSIPVPPYIFTKIRPLIPVLRPLIPGSRLRSKVRWSANLDGP